jgi:hypothetical protein
MDSLEVLDSGMIRSGGLDHELGECRPSEGHIVCHFKIGYFELHVLGAEVFLSPKDYEKSDLPDGGRHYSRDYSMEGSLTQMQC